ncbi:MULTISPECIES: lipopolysaccharide biosynthesis protein [unclassified Roseitalea]|uniref:lipopolysaccharide biosynthesis protein n=1 Tax=unclassified Roseitalea TaxID=2639107 RepID=UPI00273FAA16|nr:MULTISPECIES: lipopolysaccharide biosynthesis protein [unclassified Roseitalea]
MKQLAADNPTLQTRAAGDESLAVLAGKYARAFSGDGARVFIQLFYFYLVANTLTIAEFGLFATASSVGIVLSRVAGFGFVSPLYRIATVKPQLIGAYTGGYLLAVAISLPLVAAVGWGAHALFFGAAMPLVVFAMIAGTEIVLWRTLEVVITVNKGLERFGRASVVIVFGFSVKAAAALALALSPAPDLAQWAVIYMGGQAAMAALAVAVFYPRQRLRLPLRLFRRRVPDALSVSGAEVLFYVQNELDKLIVLSLGGPMAAGLYAIVMRLVDLTAMPVRTFSTLLTQRLMRRPQLLDGVRMRAALEAGVFALSTAALVAMVLVFSVKPDILGTNVAEAAPLLVMVLLVPGLRNLIEYQAELLYGRGQTFTRLVLYAVVGTIKAGLMVALLGRAGDIEHWLVWINAVFAALYLVSFSITYRAMGRRAVRV